MATDNRDEETRCAALSACIAAAALAVSAVGLMLQSELDASDTYWVARDVYDDAPVLRTEDLAPLYALHSVAAMLAHDPAHEPTPAQRSRS
jgi:hypothetical protein